MEISRVTILDIITC